MFPTIVQVIWDFDLTVRWQQMDPNPLILPPGCLYCPSVYLLSLMSEVQLDVTINHDLSEREGPCVTPGRRLTSTVMSSPSESEGSVGVT